VIVFRILAVLSAAFGVFVVGRAISLGRWPTVIAYGVGAGLATLGLVVYEKRKSHGRT
jgi:hypothetical protein